MINRALIRIKVVQTLYSYLLTRSDFTLETMPEKATADQKYAFGLYQDLLLLILQFSGYRVSDDLTPSAIGMDSKLHSGQMAKYLSMDSQIRNLISHRGKNIDRYRPIINEVCVSIIDSPAYMVYAKSKTRDIQSDVDLWCNLLINVINKNQQFKDTCRQQPGFTLSGYDKAFELAVGTLSGYGDNRMLLHSSHTALAKSLDQAHDLYLSLLQLICDLTRYQEQVLDERKHKYLPTNEDLYPSTRFIDNRLVAVLNDNEELSEFVEKHSSMWLQDPSLLGRLMDLITESEIYRQYMSASKSDMSTDCDLWRNLLKNVIFPSDALAEELERQSIFWNDDIDIMGTFVLKTIKQLSDNPDTPLLPRYKDDEDSRFGRELFDAAINGRIEYNEMIDNFINTRRWEADRLPLMDVVVMITAIAEMINFPAIPLRVTLSEYIEIGKAYGSESSGQFINGVLRSVIEKLQKDGRIHKTIA